MDNYMDKHTAADLLDNLIGMVEDTQENDYDTALKMGIEALKAHAQPVQRWIPCSERLPEEGVDVLLCIKDWKSQKTKMVVSLRRDYNYWDGFGREIRGDMAWMPLPEPYKDGDVDG